MRSILTVSTTVIGILALGATALAQVQPAQTAPKEPKPPRVVYRANETITFDPTEIDAVPKAPGGAFIAVRRGEQFPVLIGERAHFKAELMKSVDDLHSR